MFETQKSINRTSSGEIGLNIRTLASPKVGQDQVTGGVRVLCWHAAPVANVLWKPLAIRLKGPLAYLCVVTYATEISLIVTLNFFIIMIRLLFDAVSATITAPL